AYINDTRPGCPGYQSRTNTGSTQQVQLVRAVEVGSLGDQSLGVVLQISLEGNAARAALILLRRHEVVALATVITGSDPPDALIRGLAGRMDDRLLHAG